LDDQNEAQLALDLGVSVEPQPEDLFQWRPTSTETAERILSLLASVRAVPVSSTSINATLGARRGETTTLIREAPSAERVIRPRAPILVPRQWG
jgi:hypothetical protein